MSVGKNRILQHSFSLCKENSLANWFIISETCTVCGEILKKKKKLIEENQVSGFKNRLKNL